MYLFSHLYDFTQSLNIEVLLKTKVMKRLNYQKRKRKDFYTLIRIPVQGLERKTWNLRPFPVCTSLFTVWTGSHSFHRFRQSIQNISRIDKECKEYLNIPIQTFSTLSYRVTILYIKIYSFNQVKFNNYRFTWDLIHVLN